MKIDKALYHERTRILKNGNRELIWHKQKIGKEFRRIDRPYHYLAGTFLFLIRLGINLSMQFFLKMKKQKRKPALRQHDKNELPGNPVYGPAEGTYTNSLRAPTRADESTSMNKGLDVPGSELDDADVPSAPLRTSAASIHF